MVDSDFARKAFSKALQGPRSKPGAAGRFGAANGLLGVVVEFTKLGVLRNPDGTFTSLQGHVADANAKLAVELAESTAAAAQGSLVRPGVSSGRLAAALLHRDNRRSSAIGYGVGRPEFLDKSQARYWRQIDQGFAGHLNREIRGVFGSSLEGGGPNSRGVAGPAFTGIGAEGQRGGRLLPKGYSLLRRGIGKERSTRGVIQVPIAPHQYFRRGWDSFDAKTRTTEVVRQEVSNAFGGKGVPTPAYLASLRQGPGGGRPPSAGKRFR